MLALVTSAELPDLDPDSQLLPPALAEQDFERFGLVAGARKAVEDRAMPRGGVEPFADQRRDDGIGDELARLHHRLGLKPHRRAFGHRLAQHVAGRQLDHAALGLEALRLRTLARAGWSEKNDVQRELPVRRAASAVSRP